MTSNDVPARLVYPGEASPSETGEGLPPLVISLPRGPAACFDFGQVRDLVRQIEDDNAAWEGWFVAEGIQPYLVLYEELDADPVGIASCVLSFLGLDLPAGREITVRHRRLADELNARWIESYRLHEARERRRT